MQILTIAEQTLAEPLLFGEIWNFGANGDFLFALTSFCGVMAALILAATERDVATFRRKNN